MDVFQETGVKKLDMLRVNMIIKFDISVSLKRPASHTPVESKLATDTTWIDAL